MSIITAIYDKKARTLGRPIFQQNIEEAIRGIGDALNSKSTAGEWLMPGHREHPEDYCLVLLGHFNPNAYDTLDFDENGNIKEKKATSPIKVEERIIIELKDIELKDIETKIDWTTINANIAKAFQDFAQLQKQNLDNMAELQKKTIEGIELIANKKRGFWH